MERKIKAVKCIKDYNDNIKGEVYPIEKQINSYIYWNNGHGYNINNFNSDFWTTTFEVIYEDDEISVPDGWYLLEEGNIITNEDRKAAKNLLVDYIDIKHWRKAAFYNGCLINKYSDNYYIRKISNKDYPVLTEKDCIVGTKVAVNTNSKMWKNVKKEYPNWPEISEIIVISNQYVCVKDFENNDGSFFYFDKNCSYKSLLLVESAKTLNTKKSNPRKVTISNCKVGDKVMAGKDFNYQQGCILNFKGLGYDVISCIYTDTIDFTSGYSLTINGQFKDLELLIFYEEGKQTSHNFKTNNIIKNENEIINLSPTVATITRGKGLSRRTISGRSSRIGITIQHLGNEQVSC